MIRAEPIKARPNKRVTEPDIKPDICRKIAGPRAPYRGGKTVEATKPWLTVDPPMSRRTWYRHKAISSAKS